MTTPATRQPFPPESVWEDTLTIAYGEGLRWLTRVDDSAKAPDQEAILRRLDRPLPRRGLPSPVVISDLVRDVTTGSTTHPGHRLDSDSGATRSASTAGLWLAVIWGQHAAMTPSLAALERVTARWISELFQLPSSAFLTTHPNSYLAELRCLATARERVLRAHPANSGVTLLVSAADHRTAGEISEAPSTGLDLRREVLSSDDQGDMKPAVLRAALQKHEGPVIVRARTGYQGAEATDSLASIAAIIETAKANRPHGDLWLHLDGTHGLSAAISPELRPRVRGYDQADSWSFDTHDWLPAPADAGIAVVRAEPSQYGRAQREPARRGERSIDGDSLGALRVVAMYAAIKQLGQRAIIEAVERSSRPTRRPNVHPAAGTFYPMTSQALIQHPTG